MGQKGGTSICLGILAHVDAGKTTLSEAMLFSSGRIRKLGRVDNQDAFLDTYALERARGITIFSKQAIFPLGDKQVFLLDTPGHVDFSAEMERTLQVLDYAVLVVSGSDGVQGHTETLWRLLKRYQVPVFLFINKMDQPDIDQKALMDELKSRLSDRCTDFGLPKDSEEFLEQIAVSEERMLERYLEDGRIPKEEIMRLIQERKIFPCCFGSALKLIGIPEFMETLGQYTVCPRYADTFGAKIFKISRDGQGNRLTWMKVTGGSLKVRDVLTGKKDGEEWQEKVSQLRIYSGDKYEAVNEALAGTICVATGLTKTASGEGLGAESAFALPVLEPVLTYEIKPPKGTDALQLLAKLKLLEEEEPQLHIRWDSQLGEIQAQLMGEVQIEVLKAFVQERFGVSVDFGEGKIVYKETITDTVEGVGHFEPLRHYAEVHLLLEPGEQGSGLVFSSACSEDLLDRNWQRLILTHLEERAHRGVLTGSEITDMRITLVSGKAHLKHTEGGDFRQATYRAVRQGLMQAKSVLLEPCYEFRLEVPPENVGRAMADLEKRQAVFGQPKLENGRSVLTGTVPVSTMRNYQQEVVSYTKGRGHLTCALKGYLPCHNAEEIVETTGYNPEADIENTPDSVFCYHGAGTVVPWYNVPAHMHLESILGPGQEPLEEQLPMNARRERPTPGTYQEEKELEEIFIRTYGAPKRRTGKEEQKERSYGQQTKAETKPHPCRRKDEPLEYLLVDGYNVIFAWEELSSLAKQSIDSARGKLMDILCNYQGFRKCRLILVFDAYRVEGHAEEVVRYHNIYVVYTKEAETADQYIERTAHEIGRKYQVTVATSDGLEQIIIRGQGCIMMSARELWEEIERINQEIRREYVEQFPQSRNYLFDYLPQELARQLNEVRIGKKRLHGEDERTRPRDSAKKPAL